MTTNNEIIPLLEKMNAALDAIIETMDEINSELQEIRKLKNCDATCGIGEDKKLKPTPSCEFKKHPIYI